MINCAGLIHLQTTKEMKPFLATNKGKNNRQGIVDLNIICIVMSLGKINPHFLTLRKGHLQNKGYCLGILQMHY